MSEENKIKDRIKSLQIVERKVSIKTIHIILLLHCSSLSVIFSNGEDGKISKKNKQRVSSKKNEGCFEFVLFFIYFSFFFDIKKNCINILFLFSGCKSRKGRELLAKNNCFALLAQIKKMLGCYIYYFYLPCIVVCLHLIKEKFIKKQKSIRSCIVNTRLISALHFILEFVNYVFASCLL